MPDKPNLLLSLFLSLFCSLQSLSRKFLAQTTLVLLCIQLFFSLCLNSNLAIFTPATPTIFAQDANGTSDTDNQEKTEHLRKLRIRALQDDIATATYFELQQLAREFGVAPDKDIDTLKTSLYNKLGISPPAQSTTNQDDLVIKIESAQKAQAFTIERQEDDSEDYFKISGGVKVFITDKHEGYEHSVSADSITFNRKQNTIRAEGQVVYIKKKLNSNKDQDTEKFTGDSLIFRLRVWRGVIFYGIFSRSQMTETERPIDIHSNSSNPEKTKSNPNANNSTDTDSLLGKTALAQNNIRYYFNGEKIHKGSDDILVLENGAISTSDRKQTEYFRLGFQRLWIFGKPEWAMLSATLYVGHIPVLYLPYYYHNDSQLIFHPVFGIREAYGEFIQTTTYLLGQPQAANAGSLSFLPVTTNSNSDSQLKLDALYLVPKTKDDQQKKNKLGSDSYLKFLLDYYSYIGLFSGFQGVLKNLNFIDSLDFNLSLAYAYALEERTGFGYATGQPFILGDDNKYRLQEIKTNLFGLDFPFRYGFDASVRTKNNIFSLDFKHYSDPFYRRDYFNRTESFDWLGYGLERAQRNSENLLEEWRKKESIVSSYKWEAGFNLQPRFQTSLITSFSFKAFISSYFNKKADTKRKVYDPTREFFYPTKFFLPDVSLSMAGTIWPLTASSTSDNSRATTPLLQDWKSPAITGDKPANTTEENRLPSLEKANYGSPVNNVIGKPSELQKIKQDQHVQTFDFTATYNLVLQNLLQSQTDNTLWNRIEDIELNNKELQLSGKESFQLMTQWKFLDTFLNIKLEHDLDFDIAHYFDIAENPQSSNDLTATQQANKWNWSETANTILKPLYLFDWFANSSISHNIKAVFYDYQYDLPKNSHQGSFLDFNQSDTELRKRITKHQLVSLLDFQPIKNNYNPINNLQVSFSLTNDLPPSVPKNILKSHLFFEMFHWSHNLSIEFQQSGEDDLKYYAQPLNYTSIYKPIDKLEIQNILVYNFEDKNKDKGPHFDKEEISFKAWWFSGGLYFRYTSPYNWDKVNLAWKVSGDQDLILDKTFLQFDLTTKDHYLWNNRILFYFTFKTRWDQDLIRYNQTSSLTLDFTFSFFIHEFLNFQISYRMSNEKLYLYYPGIKDLFGLSQQHLITEDLFNSISFWDEEKQKQGPFKMKDIRFLAIHHLKDWDLIFEFAGKPKQVNNSISWSYALGFYLRWIPIPLIKRRMTFENDALRTDAR